MSDYPETGQGEEATGVTIPQDGPARAALAAADWDIRLSNKGNIPVLSLKSSPEAVEKVAAALDTLEIPYERFAPELHVEFRTPLRIKSGGRAAFVAAIKDPAVATVRSASSKNILRIESYVNIGEASTSRGQ